MWRACILLRGLKCARHFYHTLPVSTPPLPVASSFSPPTVSSTSGETNVLQILHWCARVLCRPRESSSAQERLFSRPTPVALSGCLCTDSNARGGTSSIHGCHFDPVAVHGGGGSRARVRVRMFACRARSLFLPRCVAGAKRYRVGHGIVQRPESLHEIGQGWQ